MKIPFEFREHVQRLNTVIINSISGFSCKNKNADNGNSCFSQFSNAILEEKQVLMDQNSDPELAYLVVKLCTLNDVYRDVVENFTGYLDHPGVKAWVALSKYFLGQKESAFKDIEDVRSLLADTDDNLVKSDVDGIFCFLQVKRNDFTKVISIVESWFENIAGKSSLHLQFLLPLMLEFGWSLIKTNNKQKAHEILKFGYNLAKSFSSEYWTIKYLHYISNLYYLEGNYTAAAVNYDKCLNQYRKIGIASGVAKCTNNLAVLNIIDGRLDDALIFLEQSLTAKRKIGNPEDVISTLINIATAKADLGKTNESTSRYEEIFQIAAEIGNSNYQVEALIGISRNYILTGDYLKSCKYSKQALECSVKIKDFRNLILSLNNYGVALCGLERTEAAHQAHVWSLELANECKDLTGQARAYINLCVHHFKQGDIHEALKYTEEALTLFRRLKDKPGVCLAKLNLADIYRCTGHLWKSIEIAEEAVDYLHQYSYYIWYPRALKNIAATWMTMGELNRARELLSKALILQERKNLLDNNYQKVLLLLSSVLVKMGEIEEAKLVLNKISMETIACSIRKKIKEGQIKHSEKEYFWARVNYLEAIKRAEKYNDMSAKLEAKLRMILLDIDEASINDGKSAMQNIKNDIDNLLFHISWKNPATLRILLLVARGFTTFFNGEGNEKHESMMYLDIALKECYENNLQNLAEKIIDTRESLDVALLLEPEVYNFLNASDSEEAVDDSDIQVRLFKESFMKVKDFIDEATDLITIPQEDYFF
ncbi:MAG: tetratricopeptide repeat protein [Candidatus Hodarchaeales archaeon]